MVQEPMVLEVIRAERQATRPAMLNTLLAARRAKVSDLVDFAIGVPSHMVSSVACSLAESIKCDYRTDRRRSMRRRQMVVLAVLVSRITFEIEEIPSDPDAII